MNKRHLSPKERIEAVTGPGEPDRVPLLTYSNHFQVRWAGFTYGEVMRDEDKFVEAQLSALEHFNYDGVTNLGGPGMIAESLGAELIVAEEESPSMTEPGLTGEHEGVARRTPATQRSPGEIRPPGCRGHGKVEGRPRRRSPLDRFHFFSLPRIVPAARV